MSESEDADAIDIFDHIASFGPEGFILFIFADVRQKNLTGKHFFEKDSAAGATKGTQPTDKPTSACPLNNAQLDFAYLQYVQQEGLSRRNPVSKDVWIASNYPQCVPGSGSSGDHVGSPGGGGRI
jgi:hypothetical protein